MYTRKNVSDTALFCVGIVGGKRPSDYGKTKLIPAPLSLSVVIHHSPGVLPSEYLREWRGYHFFLW